MNDEVDLPSGAPPPGAAAGVAGWYPDPWSKTLNRYWTGSAWTFWTREAGATDATPPTVMVAAPPVVAPPQPVEPTAPPPSRAEQVRPAPAPPVVKPPRKPWKASRLLVALVLGLIVGLAGVALLNRPSRTRSTDGAAASPTTGAQSTTPSRGATDPSSSALSSIVVRQPDLVPPMTVTVLPGGSGLAQPTLDLCNGSFRSETRRTARLQDVALDGQGSVALSTEAVLYADSAAATQAFSELKSVAAACPATPVKSPVGEPTIITKLNAPPDTAWAQTATVNRLAYDFTTDDGAGGVTHSVAVYLQRGRALLGVYFSQPEGPQPAIAGQNTVAGIVGLFAGRLAALPTSVVGS